MDYKIKKHKIVNQKRFTVFVLSVFFFVLFVI